MTDDLRMKESDGMVSVRKYDLEDRTMQFAKHVRLFVKKLPRTVANYEDIKQLVRSSGSVAANYIEANESLGRKDFSMKIKVCLKESKESALWLRLMDIGNFPESEKARNALVQESYELVRIFATIQKKAKTHLVIGS